MLKSRFPATRVFAVEPALSPVIGGGFIPKDLHTDLLDGVIAIEKDEAFDYARRCARDEGILVGISSEATLAAVARKLGELPPRSRILTFCYDTGERYVTIEELFD